MPKVKRENKWHFTQVENIPLLDPDLDVYEKTTYAILSYHADKDTNTCYPSYKKLCEEINCSRERLSKSLKKLQEKQYIDVKTRDNNTNIYVIKSYESLISSSRGELPSTSDELPPSSPGEHKQESFINNNQYNNMDIQKLDNGQYQYPDEFEQIWQEYPRKKSKKSAWRKWRATRRKGVDNGTLLKAVQNYALECQSRDEKYIMYARTFFGPDEHWRDYLKTEEEEQREKQFAEVEKFLKQVGE